LAELHKKGNSLIQLFRKSSFGIKRSFCCRSHKKGHLKIRKVTVIEWGCHTFHRKEQLTCLQLLSQFCSEFSKKKIFEKQEIDF
jgi:hypothetical protein